MWQEELLNYEVLKLCYIQIYPTSFFAVFWKSCQSSTYVKLRVEWCGALVKEAEEHNLVSDIKRHIIKFDTVLLHSNMSSLRRNYWSKLPTDMNVLSCGPKASNISGISGAIFPCYISRNPRSMYVRVPHGRAQFVLKVEKLSHIIRTAPILEMARAYGLRPRLRLLVWLKIIWLKSSHNPKC